MSSPLAHTFSSTACLAALDGVGVGEEHDVMPAVLLHQVPEEDGKLSRWKNPPSAIYQRRQKDVTLLFLWLNAPFHPFFLFRSLLNLRKK
jgi:hypothetical protein